MAPSTNKNSLLSDYEVFPSWTRGDETEDESDGIRLGVQRQKKRRDRRSEPSEEAVIRAETHQIDAATEFNDLEPTAPLDDLPLPSSTTTTEGAPGPTDAMSTVTLAVPSDEASSTTTTTTTSATTTTSTTTTSETIPPQDQITEAPTQPEPTDDPFSDSESGNSRPGSDTETDDDVIDDPIETEPIATLPETIDSLLPSETATSTSISASATSIDPPSPTLDAVQQARQQHHRNVETALTVVGTVSGALFLLIGAFFFWRFMKRRSRRNEALDGSYVAPLPPKPSRGARILAKIPIVRDRFGSQSWVGITETSFFDEKRHQPSPTPGFDLLGYMPDQPAPAVLMPRGQAPLPSALDKDQFFGLMGVQSASSQGRLPSYYEVAPVQQQNISPLSSDRLPRDSAYQPSETGTSLSSAFGTGTHIPPTPMQALHPPPPMRHGDFNAPEPQGLNTRRDTTYTQSSIASSVPRFRTIHSWVRQQTSRSPLQRPESQEGGRTGVESGQL